MDKGLIGVMVTVGLLVLAGIIGEVYAKHKARRAAWKLLGTRRQLEYEIARGTRAQRESMKAKANNNGVKRD